MTTIVGTQHDFASSAISLLELEYDVREAYTTAIGKLDNPDYKQKLREFSDDHERHIRQIAMLLTLHKIEFKPGPDIKQWLVKGKVILANLVSDESILRAMHTNETDTNRAYDNMINRNDMWPDAREIFMNAKEDGTKHQSWLEQQVS